MILLLPVAPVVALALRVGLPNLFHSLRGRRHLRVGSPIEYDRPKAASMIRARFAYISQITNLNEIFSLTLNFDLEGDLLGHQYWSH